MSKKKKLVEPLGGYCQPNHPKCPHLATIADLEAELAAKTCEWVYENDTINGEDFWNTGCGNRLCFVDGDPEDNKYKFCPYCGGKLVEAKE